MQNQSTTTDKSQLIRVPTKDDTAVVQNLVQQMGYKLTLSEVENRIEMFNKNAMYHSLVLELDGQVVAVAAIIMNDYFLRTTKFCYVDALVVDQQFRRIGLGAKLLNYIEQWAQNNGCKCIELHSGKHRESAGTYDFYEHLGYQKLNDDTTFFKKNI